MLAEFSYLGREKAYEIVVENTNKLADLVDDVFSPIDDNVNYTADAKKLKTLVAEKTLEKYGDRVPLRMKDRIDWELAAICENELSVYQFLIGIELVGRAVELGWTVGNRGSIASSLVAHLLDIAEINPLEAHYHCPECHYVEFHDEFRCGADMEDKVCKCGTKLKKEGFTIPPETFFGIDGSRGIDIDFNFAPDYQKDAVNHLEEISGGTIVRCGTIGTIHYKTACDMIKEFSEKEDVVFDKLEIEKLADKISRVKRGTGVHPGGIFVIPEGRNIADYTPVQHPADCARSEIITTHFDYRSLMNLLKVDILAHDMYKMIKHLEKLTNLKSADIPLDDEETFDLFNGANTAGIPEFSKMFVRDVVMPCVGAFTFDKLIRVSGLSHGTDVWCNNGEVLLREGKSVSDIISCRDDVMLCLIANGIKREAAYKISEGIGKGKGLTSDQYAELQGNGIEEWKLDSWNKIKYSFPRAHVASYVLPAYRIAYYKTHFPLEFCCAYFSIFADEFDADLLINHADSLAEEISKLRFQKPSWSNYEKLEMMEVCQEMYDKGYKFVSDNIKNDRFESFFIEDGKLRPRIRL